MEHLVDPGNEPAPQSAAGVIPEIGDDTQVVITGGVLKELIGAAVAAGVAAHFKTTDPVPATPYVRVTHEPEPVPAPTEEYEHEIPVEVYKTETRPMHAYSEILDVLIDVGENVYMMGPPATSKTSTGLYLSEQRDIPVSSVSCDMDTTKYELLGIVDAIGNLNEGAAREVFTKGGLLILDEIDSAHPSAITGMNQLLESLRVLFAKMPKSVMLSRHPDFRIVATGNTNGQGATPDHNSRNKIDAATMSRLALMPWPKDWGMMDKIEFGKVRGAEFNLDGTQKREATPELPFDFKSGGAVTPEEWADLVRGYDEKAERVGVTTGFRSMRGGNRILRHNDGEYGDIGVDWLIELFIAKGMDRQARRAVGVGDPFNVARQ